MIWLPASRRVASATILPAFGCFLIGLIGCTPNGGIDNGGGGAAPATLSGVINVARLDIPAGSRTTVTGDLEVNASGNVTIAGELIADQNPDGDGYDISIVAQGDIQIDGLIQAGAPASSTSEFAHVSSAALAARIAKVAQQRGADSPGEAGGSISLLSERGDLTIGRNATIVALDGSDATGGVTGAPAGRGGSISLCAGQGQLSVHGSLSLGNGGQGGDANLDFDMLATAFPDDSVINHFTFLNSGGDSGRLRAFGNTWDWPTLEFDESDGVCCTVAVDPLAYAAHPDTGIIFGGIGGNAGTVTVTDDLLTRLTERLDLARAGTPDTSYDEDYRFFSAAGGRGWYVGGNGGIITVTAARWYLRDGLGFTVTGANGGPVTRTGHVDVECGEPIDAIGATGGTGGHASVTSPSGIPPVTAQDAGDGGAGGKAVANGGNGGDTELSVAQIGGRGGDATAIAGAGADGLSSCFSNDVGNGGNGGLASAFGGAGGDGRTPGSGGLAIVIGGIGGRGGDGGPTAGTGGAGGAEHTKTGSDGKTGQPDEIVNAGVETDSQAASGENGLIGDLQSPDTCATTDYDCPFGQLCGQ